MRRLFERIAPFAALDSPDLPALSAALIDFAADLDYLSAHIAAMGGASGASPIHLPERGPRLTLVHRRDGEMGAVHDHGVWIAAAPVVGLETHRRYRASLADERRLELAEELAIGPQQSVTLLPPDDIHDHGHLAGRGQPAYVLILAGDDQFRYRRREWDLASGRFRVLEPGDRGRWLASDPWPEG